MNPLRKYWEVFVKGQPFSCFLYPTLRETAEAITRQVLREGVEFELREVFFDRVRKAIANAPTWVKKTMALRAKALDSKPVTREAMRAGVASLEPGIVIEGWGVHLILALDDGIYEYALLANRFDGQLTLENASALNKILLLLGCAEPPEPIPVGTNIMLFVWPADLDPPRSDA